MGQVYEYLGLSVGVVTELDRKAWSGWFLTGLGAASDRAAAWVSRADAAGTSRIEAGLAKAIGVPAKLLQLLQNGDVQWYLFFAVCSAAAMLIHFMKF
jgi:hypothetical protein